VATGARAGSQPCHRLAEPRGSWRTRKDTQGQIFAYTRTLSDPWGYWRTGSGLVRESSASGMRFKNSVRLTFPTGALIADPMKIFNARLDRRKSLVVVPILVLPILVAVAYFSSHGFLGSC
jgi:hypothetical protein